MSKPTMLILASLIAVALLGALGLAANPSARPQQAATLIGRVDALETAVADLASRATDNQELATRVSRLEAELGLAVQETPAPMAASLDDWETTTSETNEFTFDHAPDWVVQTDNYDDGLTILVPQTAQVLWFSWGYELEFLAELQEDEDALQKFAEELWTDTEEVELLSSESVKFNESSAVAWEMVFKTEEGFFTRVRLAYYQCEQESACVIGLGQLGSIHAITSEDWSLLESFAAQVRFLSGSTTRRSTWMRNCPSTACETIVMIPKGQSVEVVAQSSDGKWYQLESGEWVSASAVENAPTGLPVAADSTSQNVVKLVTHSPLTGPQAILGTAIKNGAELAVQQLGSDLAAMGVTLEVVPYDDRASAGTGFANARQMVTDPEVLCVVGHLNSGVLLSAMETYHNAQLAVVSPANTNPLVTDTGYPEINRIVGRDDKQGKAGLQFALEYLGTKSVYIIHDNTPYGEGAAESFRQAAGENDMTVLDIVGTDELEDFSGLIALILATKPDLVYFGGIYSQAGIFFGQARASGVAAYFGGPDGMDSSEIAALAGDGVVGLFYTAVAAPVWMYPSAADFAEDYEERFGEAPQPFAAQGYDAMGVCLDGVARAMEELDGQIPTRAQVAQAIRNTVDYPGITGAITFNTIGDRVDATYFVLEVQSSDPEQWYDNEIVATLQVN